jgi:hypothetical protein
MSDGNDGGATLLLVAIALLGFILIVASSTPQPPKATNQTVTSTANLNLYSDSECLTSLSSLDWGQLEPGAQRLREIYVKNTGNTSLLLTLSTSLWIPENTVNFMSLTWNNEGIILEPEQSIVADLTLLVSPDIIEITHFSFQININGESLI